MSTVAQVCAASIGGTLPFEGSVETVARFVLEAEGSRRLGGLIFEQVFRGYLKRDPTLKFSEGWLAGLRDGKETVWFKLLPRDGKLSEPDNTVGAFLAHNAPVAVIRFDNKHRLMARTWDSRGGESHFHEWAATFGVSRKSPRNMQGQADHEALDFLLTKWPRSAELRERNLWDIVRSRIAINCYVETMFDGAIDVDCFLVEKNRVYMAEFKRKYPASGGFFGIDQHLQELAGTLARYGGTLLHVVLWDIRGRSSKNTSPVRLLLNDLGQPSTKELNRCEWVGVEITAALLADSRELKTVGSDSGHRWTTRRQAGIHESKFVRLGRGSGFSIRPLLVPQISG